MRCYWSYELPVDGCFDMIVIVIVIVIGGVTVMQISDEWSTPSFCNNKIIKSSKQREYDSYPLPLILSTICVMDWEGNRVRWSCSQSPQAL